MSATYGLLKEFADETSDKPREDSKGDSKSSDSKEAKGQREQKKSKLFNNSSYSDFDWDSRSVQSHSILGEEAKDISLEVKGEHKAESIVSYRVTKHDYSTFYQVNSRISLDEAIKAKAQAVYINDRRGEIVRNFFLREAEFKELTHLAIRTYVFNAGNQDALIRLIKKKLKCLIIEVDDLQVIESVFDNLRFYSSLEELEVYIAEDSPLHEADLTWPQTLNKIRKQCHVVLVSNKRCKQFLEKELPAHQAAIERLRIPTENDNPWDYAPDQVRHLVKLGEQHLQFGKYRRFHEDLNGQALFEKVALLARQWYLPTIVEQRRLDKLKQVKLVIPNFDFNIRYPAIGKSFLRLIDVAAHPHNVEVLKWLIEQGVEVTCAYEKDSIPEGSYDQHYDEGSGLSIMRASSVNLRYEFPNFPFNIACSYSDPELQKIFLPNDHALYDALAFYIYTNALREFQDTLKKVQLDMSKPIPSGLFCGFNLFQLIIFYRRTDIFIKHREIFLNQEQAKVITLLSTRYPTRQDFCYSGWSTLAVLLHLGLHDELEAVLLKDIPFSEVTLIHPRKYHAVQLLVDGASKNHRGWLDNQPDDSNGFKRCFNQLRRKKLVNASLEELMLWDEENGVELPILHFAVIHFVYSVISDACELLKESLRHKVTAKDFTEKVVCLNPLQWAFVKRNERAIHELPTLYERHNLLEVIAEPMKEYEGISLFQWAIMRRYTFFLKRILQWKECPINILFPTSHSTYPGWLPIHVALYETFSWRSGCLQILLTRADIQVNVPFPEGGNFSHHLVGLFPLSAVFFSGRPDKSDSFRHGYLIANNAPDLLARTKNSSIPDSEKQAIYTQALAMAIVHYNTNQESCYREAIPILIQEGANIYAEDIVEGTRIIDIAYSRGKQVFNLFPASVVKEYQLPMFHPREIKEVKSISHVFVSQQEKTLAINFSQLEKTSQEIISEEVSKFIAQVLSNVQRQVSHFNRDLTDPTLDHLYHVEVLKELKKLVVVKQKEIGELTGTFRCKHLAEAVLRRLLNKIERVYLLFDPPQPVQYQRSYVDENRLRLEQRLLVGESKLAKAFAATLKDVRNKADQNGQTSLDGVYICYAEPDDEDERDKHLWWVRSFLEELRNHLLLVGIKAKLKHKDQLQGESNHDYVKKAKTSDFVLLIGTETLVRAHRNGVGDICEELRLVNQKREEDKRKRKPQVFPLLISGNNRHSFPEEYESYVKEINWLEKGKTYYQKFRVLAELLYGVNSKTFENEWKTFLGVVHGEEEQGIVKSLVDEAVLAKMAAEETVKLTEKQRETMASLKVLGLPSTAPAKVSVLSPGDSKSGDGKQETKAEKKGETKGGYFTGAPEDLSLAAQLKMFPLSSDGNKNTPKLQETPSLAASAIQFSSTITKPKRERMPLKGKDVEAIKKKLVATHQIGSAYSEGDCFFDSVAQGLEALGIKIPGEEKQEGYKRLRVLCHEYLNEKERMGGNWAKEVINKDASIGVDDYPTCLKNLKFTQPEMDRVEGYSIWGRPHIEGRILCERLEVQIHVVEFFEHEGQMITTHKLVDANGAKEVGEEEILKLQDSKLVHIVNYRGHYVPLLPLGGISHNLRSGDRQTSMPLAELTAGASSAKGEPRGAGDMGMGL